MVCWALSVPCTRPQHRACAWMSTPRAGGQYLVLLWSSPPWQFCIPAHDWSCEAALLSPPCSSLSIGGGCYTPGQSRQALGLLPTPWGAWQLPQLCWLLPGCFPALLLPGQHGSSVHPDVPSAQGCLPLLTRCPVLKGLRSCGRGSTRQPARLCAIPGLPGLCPYACVDN